MKHLFLLNLQLFDLYDTDDIDYDVNMYKKWLN